MVEAILKKHVKDEQIYQITIETWELHGNSTTTDRNLKKSGPEKCGR